MKLGDGVVPTSAYDANGNIKAMTQKGLKLYQSEELDKLAYSYEYSNYSNKLQAVSETAAGGTAASAVENTLGDFKDNIANSLTYDYKYDLNGNLVKDLNKGIGTSTTDGIEYNYLNLPSKVTIVPPSGGGGAIAYLYDATGERLQKTVQPASGGNITYTYAGPFTYRNDQLQYIYTEDGRIRPTVSQSGAAGWAYDYFIKDHLGNIRMILTDEQRTDVNPKVTFEENSYPDNPDFYDREDVSLIIRPASFGTIQTNGRQVQLLRKSGQAQGVSKLLKVMVKDKVNVTVDYFFASATVDNSGASGITTLINTLLPFFNGNSAPPALKGSGSPITQQLNIYEPLNTLLKPQNASEPSALPKAYLNILFFDEQMRFVKQNSKIVQVATAGSRQTINEINIEAPENGYVYTYVSNESNNLVYFDNFQVSHTRGPVLEETHLYPFGSRMTAICSRALPGVQNNLAFQSKELDEEFDLDWFDFGARYYDPQLGRFIQSDPADQFASGYTGMGNNWVYAVDPDGQFAFIPILIGAVIGAYSGGMAANGGDFNPASWNWQSGKTWGYILGGAIIGGASGGLSHAVASSGMPFANTAGILSGSFTNSIGMNMLTGGQTSISAGFGFGSYNFSTGEFGYLGKKGNSALENFGYGLGLIGNIQDGLAGLKPGEVQLQTENDPTSSDKGKDLISHSQIVDKDGKILIDYGPKDPGTGRFLGFSPGQNSWEDGTQLINKPNNLITKATTIKGVNVERLNRIAARLNNHPGSYNFLLKSCSSVASRSLLMSGVYLAGGIHPYLLRFSTILRSLGVRPSLFSHHLTN